MLDDDVIDVAALRFCDHEHVARIRRAERRFLTAADVARGHYQRFEIFGWPTASIDRRGDDLRSSPLWIGAGVYRGAEICAQHEFLLEWVRAAQLDLHGISGCPVWAKREANIGEVWEPSREYQLAGIEISVLKGEWIKVVRWDVVQQLITAFEARSP